MIYFKYRHGQHVRASWGKLAFDNKITLQEIRELTLGYLHGRGYYGDHIKEQLNEVTKMFGKKIQ